jgi:hypothetical protein
MFACSHCQRNYQRKIYFDRHVIACQFLAQSKRERLLESEELADTPTVRELYSIILALGSKCNELETKLIAIQKWTHITKKKLNITEWLNTTYAVNQDYEEWFAQINVDALDLAGLFETDYVNGVIRVLKQQLLPSNEQRPVRAFTSKENTFYIYRAQKWLMCDEDTFTKLMYLFDKQFMREFIRWQNENKSRMSTDDSFSDLYAKNMKKIMGGNSTREQLYSRIKKEFYLYIRSEPPNIMEYETTF